MPRTKVAQRCEQCRRRRIKCDANWPTCTPCLRSRLECPGPGTGFEFRHHDEGQQNTQAESSRRRRRRQQEPPDSGDRAVAEATEALAESSVASGSSEPSPPQSATPTQDALRTELIRILQSGPVAASLRFVSARAYLSYMPAMIGSSVCLDSVIRCICDASVNLSRGIDTRQSTSWTILYTQALSHLQQALNSRTESLTSTTLAAVHALKMLEIALEQNSSARQHSRGLAQLIRHRGPHTFREPVELAIFEVEAMYIVYRHYKEGEDCFVAGTAWVELQTSMIESPSTDHWRMSMLDLRGLRGICRFTAVNEELKQWLTFVPGLAAPPQRSEAVHVHQGTSMVRDEIATLRTELVQGSRRVRDLATRYSCAGQMLVLDCYLMGTLLVGTSPFSTHPPSPSPPPPPQQQQEQQQQQMANSVADVLEYGYDAVATYAELEHQSLDLALYVGRLLQHVWQRTIHDFPGEFLVGATPLVDACEATGFMELLRRGPPSRGGDDLLVDSQSAGDDDEEAWPV